MLINFTKMQGLGNDFVVIDTMTQSVKLHTHHLKQIADRHFGIGCDQIILIEPPTRSQADFYYRIFNANGKEVEQCGNGARCAVRFFHDNRFTHRHLIQADCLSGSLQCFLEPDKTVSLNMGEPIFSPDSIPFVTPQESLLYSIEIAGKKLSMSVLSMGNPHAIVCVPSVAKVPLKEIGPLFSTHSSFPREVNVGFMEILDRSHILLRTYERGVGETLSCGTNSCAAVVAGISQGLLDASVSVVYPSGHLIVDWKSGEPVRLRGPAETVFTGHFSLKALDLACRG